MHADGETFTHGWNDHDIARALEILGHRDEVILAAVRIMSKAEIRRRCGIARDTIDKIIISRSPHARSGRS